MPRWAKSFHRTVLMLPCGFIANEPPPGPLCPVSVFAETAPSTVAMNDGAGVGRPAPPARARVVARQQLLLVMIVIIVVASFGAAMKWDAENGRGRDGSQDILHS